MDRYLSHARVLRRSFPVLASMLLSALALAGCEVIGDIFKAGVWVGVLLVVGVVALIVWLIARSMG